MSASVAILGFLPPEFLWTVFGAGCSIAAMVVVEALRRPRLEIRIPKGRDLPVWKWSRDEAGKSPDEVAISEAYFAYLEVYHKPLPGWSRWLLREPAIGCHGEVTIHYRDTKKPIWNHLDGPMPTRWFRSPDPKRQNEDGIGSNSSVFDPNEFSIRPRMDILPGESELIDVVAYIEEDDYVHCWNNENYLYENLRNNRRRLRPNRYYVAVTVVCSGAFWRQVFDLDVGNPENMNWHPVEGAIAQKVIAEQDELRRAIKGHVPTLQ